MIRDRKCEHTLCPKRIVLETGTLSNLLAHGMHEYGLPVEVIDAHQTHGVIKLQHNKTDANDAVLLAEIARTGFCRLVAVNGEDAERDRMLIKARRHLVGQRHDTQNAIRGFLCARGIRFPKGSGKLAKRWQSALQDRPDLVPTIEPLLASVRALKTQIKNLDKEVLKQAKISKPDQLLMSIHLTTLSCFMGPDQRVFKVVI